MRTSGFLASLALLCASQPALALNFSCQGQYARGSEVVVRGHLETANERKWQWFRSLPDELRWSKNPAQWEGSAYVHLRGETVHGRSGSFHGFAARDRKTGRELTYLVPENDDDFPGLDSIWLDQEDFSRSRIQVRGEVFALDCSL